MMHRRRHGLAVTVIIIAASAFGACTSTALDTRPTIDAAAVVMPNAAITPGEVLSTNVNEICISGYAKRTRDVSTATKNEVYAEYGITSHAPNQYEIDHLIPLGIGGANDIRNLWPQPTDPRPGRLEKDALEDELHNRICDRSLDIRTAQQAVATNWLAAYLKYVLHH